MIMETKWEYKLVSVPNSSREEHREVAEGRLNQKGQEGWEAVGLTRQGTEHALVLLKRPFSN